MWVRGYYENGIKYKGEFKNGNPNGIGIYIGVFGKYEGKWNTSENNIGSYGYGIEYYKNGRKYEVEFKNGLSDGYGIYYYRNGSNMKDNLKL